MEFKDNSDLILKELENRKPKILNAMGTELYKAIYNFMTDDRIVDTGRLQGSISYSTPYNNYNNPIQANKPTDFIQDVKEKDTVVYGSNCPYASFLETGTTKQRARHYIKTGTYRSAPVMKKVVEEILKKE